VIAGTIVVGWILQAVAMDGGLLGRADGRLLRLRGRLLVRADGQLLRYGFVAVCSSVLNSKPAKMAAKVAAEVVLF